MLIQVIETKAPQPKDHEVLVKVYATAINRADTLQRKGQYPPPAGESDIMGLEMAGSIVEVGSAVKGLEVGQRVMGLLAGGGYAEFVCVPAVCCMPIPEHLSYDDAAAIPEVWLTAFQLLHKIAKVQAGEIVLIHAGASGVGTAAIQLCRLAGAIPIVTAGSKAKCDFCLELGAAAAINYKEAGGFSAGVKAALQEQKRAGVDVVLDCIGASYVSQHLEVLALDSRWVLYGLMGGREADKFPLGGLLAKRIQLLSSTLRTRTISYKGELVQNFSEVALAHFKPGGVLRPIIDTVLQGLAAVEEAHKRMEADQNIGKIVIRVQ